MSAFITGSGTSLPPRVVTNEELGAQLGLSPGQIFKSSGIRARRWADAGTPTSTLAVAALHDALTDASCAAAEIDYLLCGTMTPDRFIPGIAPAVQHGAALGDVPSLDIRATCCNALYGLQLARALVTTGAARNVALCLAEVQSAWLELSADAGTISMLFGDGAAALVISGEARAGALEIVDVLIATDGTYTDDLGVRRPGTEFGAGCTLKASAEASEELADFRPRMQGQSVILHAGRKMSAASKALLERNRLTIVDVRWLVPHQANANLLAQVARALGFQREDGVVSVIAEYGNTSSASIGIALDALRRSGRIKAGDYLLLPAFGAGFTWGAALCLAA
jgi:3-oxoacyl-[acyl-carrier-protein] synthase-3